MKKYNCKGKVPHDQKSRRKKTARKVVITGIGIVSPIGIGVEEFWENLLEGKSGIDTIRQIDAESFPSQIAGEVVDFEARAKHLLTKRQAKYYSRVCQFASAAFALAKKDANLNYFDPYRTDVILGSATSALAEFDRQVFRNPTAGREWVEGAFESQVLGRVFMNGPACAIALMEDIQGHVTTLSSACASSLNALGLAAERLKDGRCDIAITGGADCGINYFSLNSFCATESLATCNDVPGDALCPFDKRRTKSVLGEGAAIFILEDERHAKARGARIYAEVSSFSQNYENTNELYLLDRTGKRWARTIRNAIEQGSKSKIDFIAAHAPSDELIDEVEALAFKEAIGEKVSNIPVSSIKGSVGSALGAAGGLQLAAAALAVRTGWLHPTRNFKVPDPKVPLKVITAKKKTNPQAVLVNAHGFGGVNVSVLLERGAR